LQVLNFVFDPRLSECSFGFPPGRSAHQAVERARQSIQDGAAWVVDVDLDAFFDRVQHDALMARVERRVHDKQGLCVVRRYLEAGVMADGVKQRVEEGTPQGSPLSPLLTNVMRTISTPSGPHGGRRARPSVRGRRARRRLRELVLARPVSGRPAPSGRARPSSGSSSRRSSL
jgi:hypothetical protein